MEKIALLVDSGCNLKEDWEKGIFVAPIHVNFSDETKRDLFDISPSELYERLDQEEVRTSAPNLSDFNEKIEKARNLGYKKILGISISSEISASHSFMKIALRESGIEFEALDSRSASFGAGLLAIYARELIERGHGLEEIFKILEERKENLVFFGAVKDLKYLIRGGRISQVKGRVGSLLKVNPIISFDQEGKIYNYKSIRGENKALSYMVEMVEGQLKEGKRYYFSLMYARDGSEVEEFKSRIEGIIKGAKIYIEAPITAALGVYIGPSAYGFSYMEID